MKKPRLRWTEHPDGSVSAGDYHLVHETGAKWPWQLLFQERPMLQAHGNYTGYRRFKTLTNGQRWVERRLRERPYLNNDRLTWIVT